MKKSAFLMSFILAVLISSTAFAANWVEIDKFSENGVFITTYVDKDSIKRGIESKQFNMSSKDGFSANVRFEFNSEKENKTATLTNYVGFIEKNGKKVYYCMDLFDENGNLIPAKDKNLKADEYSIENDGEVWIKVWDFISQNLK
ncbi:MAG: hypothetical protein IK062_05725 [Selenomonadaceae bacterium]|nr:hypothetical protein [Selenomonadaceae bacterium]